MTIPADPIPAIAEVEATGETAALFQDIRQSLGVPVVNLIFRHLATFPDVLPWCWQSLKPLYLNGTIDAQAHALRSTLFLPTAAPISGATLADAQLASGDLKTLRTILRSYERSNAMNMIAFGALLAQLNGTSGSQPARPIEPISTEHHAAALGTMPRPLAMSEMDEQTRMLTLRLAAIGGDHPIIPTMYRHFAHWPRYLELLCERLVPLDETAALKRAVDDVLDDAQNRGLQMVNGLEKPEMTLDPSKKAALIETIDTFQRRVIGKMIVIVGVIQQAMPAGK